MEINVAALFFEDLRKSSCTSFLCSSDLVKNRFYHVNLAVNGLEKEDDMKEFMPVRNRS